MPQLDAGRRRQVEQEHLVQLVKRVAVDRHGDRLAGDAAGKRERAAGRHIVAARGGGAVGRGVLQGDRVGRLGDSGPDEIETVNTALTVPKSPSVTVTLLHRCGLGHGQVDVRIRAGDLEVVRGSGGAIDQQLRRVGLRDARLNRRHVRVVQSEHDGPKRTLERGIDEAGALPAAVERQPHVPLARLNMSARSYVP